MTTTQKNAWIASEEHYQKLFIENYKDKNTSILSQLTFCTDGVIIKKYMETKLQNAISFQVLNETMEEFKSDDEKTVADDKILLEVKEFGKEEVNKYLSEIVETTMK